MPSTSPASPPACSRTRSPTMNGRAEISTELPARLAAVTPDQVQAAAAALRSAGRGVLLVEPKTEEPA